MNGEEFNINQQIEILEEHIEIATKMQDKQMKSNVQTYDIRDSPEYRGVFEVEMMLKTIANQEKID